ncbi:MAG: glycosyltransferase [Candidatus Sericytochromatia bacterium]|nr:glycosyltransferase [Candidatus Tanganyikabacteria bacterium]
MEFTGERFIPGEVISPICYEHAHRYLFARRWADGRRVLDIGCGEGYGSALLAATAQSVVGVDVSEEAVAHATSQYGKNQLTYLVASAERIPLPDRAFDLIVAFEVIEHVPDPFALLREAQRLLAPGGIFLVSSPNKRVYSDIPGFHNPYHIKEFYVGEFETTLEAYFPAVRLLGQRLVTGSMLWPVRDGSVVSDVSVVSGGRTVPTGTANLTEDEAVYVLAICGDRDLLDAPSAAGDLLVDRNDHVVRELEAHVADMMVHMKAKDAHIADMMGHMQGKDAHIADMMGHMQGKDAHIADMMGHMQGKDAHIADLQQHLERRTQEIADHQAAAAEQARRLQYQVARLEGELGDMHRSPGYRLARALRIYRPRNFPPYAPGAALVSIILVNYNGKHYLEPCLDALEKQTYPREQLEIILVDNASTDDSAAFVRERYPAVKLIAAPRNLGFAGGNNLGFQHARGDLIALLNNDTVVAPGWLEALVDAIRGDPRVGTVAARIYFKNEPGVINNVGLNLYRDGSGGDRGFRVQDEGQFDQGAVVFGACGASMLIRREVLDDVGVFDERFFMYYEDLDLAWRARIRGWESRYEPGAIVHHVHCGSSEEWSPFFVFHVERNRVLANVKCAPWPQALRVLASFAYRAVRRWKGILTLRERSASERALAVSLLKAAVSLAWELPGALWQRLKIRGWRRLVPDDAFAYLIAPNP